MTNQADLNCTECCFYRDVEEGVTLGTCKYPVPEWIKINSGGGFVNGYEAENCTTFKSMHDLIQQSIKD